MTIDYRTTSEKEKELMRSERRGWIGMVVWIAGFLAVALLLSFIRGR